MDNYVIYKATNIINGKMYIGKTNNFEKRKQEHLFDRRGNSVFHKAIDKYGANNFIWEVIDYAQSYDEINELEKHYIKQYNTYKPNGYNMTKGGDGGSMWNARPVVRLTLDGQFVKRYDCAADSKEDGFHSSDVLASCKNKNRTTKNHIFMFEEEYLKDGPRKYVKPLPNHCKKIIQCDLHGNYIAEYESIATAARETNTNRTSVVNVLSGNYKTANGFIFVYKEDFPIENVEVHKHKKKGKRIAQIDIETKEIIKVFDRIADAGRELNVSYKAIHKVVDLPGRTAYGYIWQSY